MTPDQTATVLSAERVLEAALTTMRAARYCSLITVDSSGRG